LLLEVIATTAAEALEAAQNGADRIELIDSLAEGGLTPRLDTIEETVATVGVPVHVMVRPHSRTFCYDEEDVRVMLATIREIRRIGAAGIVVGALTANRRIDAGVMNRLMEEADGMAVTFHRAFDEVPDQLEALEQLSRLPLVNRVLTSGGAPNALWAREQIRRLVVASEKTKVNVLAGGGLTIEALAGFVADTGVREVHFGSAVRVDGKPSHPIDPAKIREVRRILNGMQQSDP
jgi:copper homeostasis protein